jgi:hypothetical protein
MAHNKMWARNTSSRDAEQAQDAADFWATSTETADGILQDEWISHVVCDTCLHCATLCDS